MKFTLILGLMFVLAQSMLAKPPMTGYYITKFVSDENPHFHTLWCKPHDDAICAIFNDESCTITVYREDGTAELIPDVVNIEYDHSDDEYDYYNYETMPPP